MQPTQPDKQVLNLTKAIRQTESGGNYDAKGASGESGAYQWTPNTWKAHAKQALGDENAQMTKDNQNAVAYTVLKSWRDEGLNPAQIAARWNSGSEHGWENKKGVNKFGVEYDVPRYVKSVTDSYQKIARGEQVGMDANNPSSISGTQQVAPPQQEQAPQNPDSLMSHLGGRVGDIAHQFSQFGKGQTSMGGVMLNTAGAIAGGVGDVIGAAANPVIDKVVDTVSNIPAVQSLAQTAPVSGALDTANAGIQNVQQGYQKFGEAIGEENKKSLESVANIGSLLPVGKGAQIAADTAVGTAVKGGLADISKMGTESAINRVKKNIYDVETANASTRKNINFSKDENAGARDFVARSGVLDDAITPEGLILTKQKGGAMDRFKEKYLDGTETKVRDALVKEGVMVSINDVKKYLMESVMKGKLEGDALRNAVAKIEREAEGLQMRANDKGMIPLSNIQDSKVGTYNATNWATDVPQERRAFGDAYMRLIEDKSGLDVKPVNADIARHLKALDLLESLDGKRVKGGRLGKYTSKLAGNAVGAAAGSVFGPLGAVTGAYLGGELTQKLQSRAMQKTFRGSKKGTPPPVSQILKDKIKDKESKKPLLQLPAPGGTSYRSSQVGNKIMMPQRTVTSLEALERKNPEIKTYAKGYKTRGKIEIKSKPLVGKIPIKYFGNQYYPRKLPVIKA